MVTFSILAFYILCFTPVLFVIFPVKKAIHAFIETEKPLPIFPLAISTSITTFLLFFSFIGRILSSYQWTLPVCYFFIGCYSYFFLKRSKISLFEEKNWKSLFLDVKKSTPFILFFFILHFSLWWLRSFFPDIHFDPNHLGAEKLFNYHFQQSFVHGSGYPPQDLWLAGESISYYALPKALSGLSSFFLREFAGAPMTGGILFGFSDTFFVALSSTVLASSVALIIRKFDPNSKDGAGALLFSFLVGLIPLLSAPSRSIRQTFSGNIDLWSLSRVIENTINEYPFWNFIWADNHAHSSVIFMQLTLIFWTLAYLGKAQWKVDEFWSLIAFLPPVVLMSHSGSVLIDLVILTTLAIFILAQEKSKKTVKPFVLTGFSLATATLLLSAPDFTSRSQPLLKWYFVPHSLSTSLVDFLNINLVLILFIFLTIALVLNRNEKNISKLFCPVRKTSLEFSFGFFVLFSAVGYPVVGLCLFIAGVARHALESADQKPISALRCGCIYAAMLMWIFPEIVACNLNMGEQYMRYNSLFRFLFESFYIIPILWTYAFMPSLINLRASKNMARFYLGPLALIIAILIFVQLKTFEKRLSMTPGIRSFDGTEFLKTERKVDWAIIQFLAHLPTRVVIAEECGIHPKSGAYSVAGRLSAYSGRTAICGWSNHTQQWQTHMKNGFFKDEGTWDQLIKRNEWTTNMLNFSFEKGLTDNEIQFSLQNFEKIGVTHLAFGEWEKELHPKVQIGSLARLGKIVFEQNGMGVIELSYRSKHD